MSKYSQCTQLVQIPLVGAWAPRSHISAHVVILYPASAFYASALSKKEVEQSSLTSVTRIKLRENHNQERRTETQIYTHTRPSAFSAIYVNVKNFRAYIPARRRATCVRGRVFVYSNKYVPLFGLISPACSGDGRDCLDLSTRVSAVLMRTCN